ncbi:MAG TPA: cytochrome c [Acidobacteriaceae bacterium]|jgi:mono/diheme cytochrome c family protein
MKRWLLGVLCFLAGVLVVPAAIYVYLDLGRPPVAVSDGAFPMEKTVVHKILGARIDKEVETVPMQPTDAALIAGAGTYKQQCAFCHGLPGKSSQLSRNMYPSIPQLWMSHRAGVVGVSDDPSGETYWKIKNGIRLTGMPSYKNILTEEQMWQVSLLLSSAAKPLPPDASATLAGR